MSVPSWQICQQSTVDDGVFETMGCIDARHFIIIEEGGALSDGKVLIREMFLTAVCQATVTKGGKTFGGKWLMPDMGQE